MKHEYIDCKLGLTPQCPNFTEPSMRKMFASIKTAGAKVRILDDVDIEIVNRLCEECNEFVPM